MPLGLRRYRSTNRSSAVQVTAFFLSAKPVAPRRFAKSTPSPCPSQTGQNGAKTSLRLCFQGTMKDTTFLCKSLTDKENSLHFFYRTWRGVFPFPRKRDDSSALVIHTASDHRNPLIELRSRNGCHEFFRVRRCLSEDVTACCHPFLTTAEMEMIQSSDFISSPLPWRNCPGVKPVTFRTIRMQ